MSKEAERIKLEQRINTEGSMKVLEAVYKSLEQSRAPSHKAIAAELDITEDQAHDYVDDWCRAGYIKCANSANISGGTPVGRDFAKTQGWI